MSQAKKIVVLDGYTTNPGDLDWSPLQALGECVIHERTAREQTASRCAGADIVLTNKTVIDRNTIEANPSIRYIGVMATGYNIIDMTAARSHGIIVANASAYSTASVAQLTIALILELMNNVGVHAGSTHEGMWCTSKDFTYTLKPQVELANRVLGLVGCGAIGQSVARIAESFGMRVLAYTRSARSLPGIENVALETLFHESHVVSLHCPMTPETDKLVNRERLAWMRPDACIINTARGALVDETALAQALLEGRIAGAGLDVLSSEPPARNNPLLKAPNCFITPHLGWATRAARRRLLDTVVQNIEAFLARRPQNVVD